MHSSAGRHVRFVPIPWHAGAVGVWVLREMHMAKGLETHVCRWRRPTPRAPEPCPWVQTEGLNTVGPRQRAWCGPGRQSKLQLVSLAGSVYRLFLSGRGLFVYDSGDQNCPFRDLKRRSNAKATCSRSPLPPCRVTRHHRRL
jgi:hypothetical protein